MPYRSVRFAKHHLHIAKLALTIMRTASLVYFNEQNFGSCAPEVLMCIGIFIGQLEGRPMSAMKLAQYIGMPRATVIRKLTELMSRGLVERYGRSAYLLPLQEVNRHDVFSAVTMLVREIQTASTELSKLDK